MSDNIKLDPLHYRTGAIEPWDFISAQRMNFIEGNIIKYVTRYKHKDGLLDLKKAKVYLDRLILETEQLEQIEKLCQK